MKVSVLGWTSHSNVGDEAYKICLPKLLPEAEFDFDNADGDICLIGGGDILDAHYIGKALKTQAKKKIAVSVSATSNTPIDLAKQLDLIYIRDRRSQKYLEENGVACRYMPDVAHLLKPDKDAGAAWLKAKYQEEGLDLYAKKVGVVFNAHLYHGKPDLLARDFHNLIRVVWDIAKLMDSTPASFILFPMSTGLPYDDRVTNGMIGGRTKFWKKNCVIYDKLDVQETLNLVSCMDVVVSTRLHASIFSTISGVPFIDLTHHDKNKGYLESVGLTDFSISYWSMNYDALSQRLNDILEGSESYRARVEDARCKQLEILQEESCICTSLMTKMV